MAGSEDSPWLLTPGPLTTAPETRAAMARDLGSRDAAFVALTARVRSRLLEISGGAGSHVCVPMQGSGTFAVEAMIGTLLPRGGRVLVPVNGAYGRRIVRICEVAGREAVVLETAEDVPADPAAIARTLEAEPEISHVALVHVETTTGLLNPVAEIADVVAAAGRLLLLDSMSAFGALPLDVAALPATALAASAGKCLEGVPGVGFVIVRERALAAAAGQCHSLSLDLCDQWRALEANGQWRFTPPTHVMAALDRALDAFVAEGGTAGRGARYRENCAVLVAGLRDLGLEVLLPEALQAPVIVTIRAPRDPAWDFDEVCRRMAQAGYVIYPGKLTAAPSFRIGCIGAIDADVMRGALSVLGRLLDEMGVRRRGPA